MIDRTNEHANPPIQPNAIPTHIEPQPPQTRLLAKMWDYMGLIRVYTKRRGAPPLFNDPLVLSSERKGISVEVGALRVFECVQAGALLIVVSVDSIMDGWVTTTPMAKQQSEQLTLLPTPQYTLHDS